MWKLPGCFEVKNCKGKPSYYANFEKHHGVFIDCFSTLNNPGWLQTVVSYCSYSLQPPQL